MVSDTFCPVCRIKVENEYFGGRLINVTCDRCGTYKLSDSCIAVLQNGDLLDTDIKKASVGHWLRHQQRYDPDAFLKSDTAEKLAAKPYFPSLQNQFENLLLYLGDSAGTPGERVDINTVTHQYIVGCKNPSAIEAIISEMDSEKLVTSNNFDEVSGLDGCMYWVYLTFSGWLKYEEVLRGTSTGRRAFLATPFGKPDLDNEWHPRLKEAVKETGFDLKRVDDEPKPGNIDVRMRMQIKEARFLIVELTHANLGAYWEAGYAEGLGKPVIYTCHKDVDRVHFDVDHMLRIIWDPENIDDALSKLKATIRFELPDAISDQS